MRGGFYKYRCKYFLSHDCPNWVYVNHAPCADCCAAGREGVDTADDNTVDIIAGCTSTTGAYLAGYLISAGTAIDPSFNYESDVDDELLHGTAD